jgi:hypothetical protein
MSFVNFCATLKNILRNKEAPPWTAARYPYRIRFFQLLCQIGAIATYNGFSYAAYATYLALEQPSRLYSGYKTALSSGCRAVSYDMAGRRAQHPNAYFFHLAR